MPNKVYDIAVLGSGIAGSFAINELSKHNLKVCLIEFGRPPGKRRKQLEGFLGCLLNSNSRWYINDYSAIKNISGVKLTEKADKIVKSMMMSVGSISQSRNKEPTEVLKTKLNKNNYNLSMDNYIQWKPESTHLLSRNISEEITDKQNVELMFDTEIFDIEKKTLFHIKTENGTIVARKILLCLGRSGWRFTAGILDKFHLLLNNDYAYYGFRAEISSSFMKEWNESHCSVSKDNMLLGPFCWKGTVIPEDHCDLVITAFRSNEERWNSNQVSFPVIAQMEYKNNGYQQTERLGKLCYILSDNRVGKIRIKDYLTTINDISHIPEYKWLNQEMNDINKIIPSFTEKAYMYIPDIITSMQKIKLNKDFSSEVSGLYVAGESAGHSGIYFAALSGTIAALNMIK